LVNDLKTKSAPELNHKYEVAGGLLSVGQADRYGRRPPLISLPVRHLDQHVKSRSLPLKKSALEQILL
jgi:hypothetical protein